MLVRIVKDPTNRDGWTAKLLSSDPTLSGKVCFISNLDHTIQDLIPGQVWSADLIIDRDRYLSINLTARN